MIETMPPHKMIVSKEPEDTEIPNSRHLQLEIAVLEADLQEFDCDADFKMAQWKLNMPTEIGMDDGSIFELTMKELNLKRAKTRAIIAQKQLELFEIQGR